MANLPESSTFDSGVYQIETTDPVIGGPSGVTNTPLKNLANRTKYLKDHVDALEAGTTPAGAASKLATARNIGLSGDVSGTGSFDGQTSISISATVVQASAVSAGKVQLATVSDALAAIDQSKAVTPAGLANYLSTSKMGVVGQVAFFAMNSVPAGWMKCNGAAVSRITYASLFSAIGTMYGAGDGANTFNLPDFRGEFLRGFDDGRGVDNGRAIGSLQLGTIISGMDDNGTGQISSLSTPGYCFGDNLTSSQWDAINGNRWISPESLSNHYEWGAYATTRPRNVAVLACIKF